MLPVEVVGRQLLRGVPVFSNSNYKKYLLLPPPTFLKSLLSFSKSYLKPFPLLQKLNGKQRSYNPFPTPSIPTWFCRMK